MIITETSSKKKGPASESERAKCKALMDKMRKEGEKLVKGMFEFVDAGGGWLEFSHRFFPGPIQTVKIIHGEICDIPMILAKHLNNVYKKVRLPATADASGVIRTTLTKTSRCRFTPMDIM